MEQNDSQKIMVINCCNDICDEKLKNISNSSNDVDNVIQNPIENDSENLTLLSTSGNDDLIDNLIDSVVNDSTENFINNNQNNDNAFKSDIYIDEVNDNIGSDEINITKNIYFNENSVLNTSEPKIDKICQFPLGRIKTIIKSDPDVNIISSESVFLISKATELFLQWLGKEIYSYTVQQKKKTIQVKDLNMAISENLALEFLDGALN